MLTPEKRTTFMNIMDGYTRAPRFETIPYTDSLPGFDSDPDLDENFDLSQVDDNPFAYSNTNPSEMCDILTEEDLRFLRDFILGMGMYVDQLESLLSDTSEEFWQAREHAYRIVTNMLIKNFLYELEEEESY